MLIACRLKRPLDAERLQPCPQSASSYIRPCWTRWLPGLALDAGVDGSQSVADGTGQCARTGHDCQQNRSEDQGVLEQVLTGFFAMQGFQKRHEFHGNSFGKSRFVVGEHDHTCSGLRDNSLKVLLSVIITPWWGYRGNGQAFCGWKTKRHRMLRTALPKART